ncbi:hypothetical protein CkaCkLH20_05805 [Colletotrichum karsti]|uniref:Uncharacterized protein n=1 Tax=Colletotrichum karsti TaxID=1095194 RepID=A0A9P6LI47_9PEZI|nr:uncharacterized protein CkaCkLH20_05805 [Colletotrichum karsti]KAF9876959.1 hypothetical protein CkaCkLH20_05805 [Colletotrichum karsti]
MHLKPRLGPVSRAASPLTIGAIDLAEAVLLTMSSRCACARLTRLPVAAGSSLNLTRPFSTTSANLKVPPESPGWIQVPVPPQSQSSEQKLPVVKGTLPIPRDPFPRKEADRKVQPEYLEQTARKPTNEASQKPAAPGSRLDHRRRMAENRRENLETALKGLYKRKKERVDATTAASKQRLWQHQQAAVAPERSDDLITRSSVLSSLETSTAVELDPARYERAAESKARTAALAKQKSEAKQDALMEMYINAANFIVDEQDLNEQLDQLFSEDFWKRQGRSMAHMSDNAWGVWGQPPTVQSMLDEMLRRQQRAIDFQQSEQERTVTRQKTIAEELTGGKME